MKFARSIAVLSLVSASSALPAACGPMPNSDLFSPSAGASNSARAGANNGHAGANNAGASEGETAGVLNGAAGTIMVGGDAGDSNDGSSGAPAGGTSSGGEGGAPKAGAGGAPSGGARGGAGGARGGAGGAPAAGSAGVMGGAGGAPAAGAGGAMAGTGGAMAGASGSAGGAAACPVRAPKDNTQCSDPTPSSCFYAGEACSCLSTGKAGAQSNVRRWACYGSLDACPSAKPVADTSCWQNLGDECPYPDQDFCVCRGSLLEAKWVCQVATATCPANKPSQTACKAVQTCQYSDVACFCNSSSWSCLSN